MVKVVEVVEVVGVNVLWRDDYMGYKDQLRGPRAMPLPATVSSGCLQVVSWTRAEKRRVA